MPTSTSILNITSPIYDQIIDAAAADASTTGGEAANTENMIQDITITAPSRQTAAYDFMKLIPILCVGSPAKDDRGIGAIAVYIYSLKNLPYTVSIITKDSIHINREPIKVTAHSGIDSKKEQASTAVTISAGRVVPCGVP